MNDIEVLNTLVEFLKNNVAKKIKLKKPPKNNEIDGEYVLVNPAVYKGWVPPKNYLDEYGYDVPTMIVMLDDGTDEDNSAHISIRIKIITYDPGETKENGIVSPNVSGYIDLLNVITKIRIELSQNPIILEKVNVNKPIKWSMDQEQSYPYWSADLNFDVSIAPLAFNINKDIFKIL